MKSHGSRIATHRRISAFAAVLGLFVLASFLASCNRSAPTSEVLVVTATYSPEPVVIVVTATFTPTPPIVPSDTPLPVTDTPQPPPPTATLPPTEPPPTAAPTVAPTEAVPTVAPTKEPAPTVAPTEAEPTAESAQAAPTQALPSPKNTATTQPASAPTAKPPSLGSYFVVYTAFKGPDLQDYSLWGMNGDGSDVFKIEGAGQASEPAFSPDGNKFAFYHWTDGIYVWNLAKETSMRVVENSEAAFATWSPNNQRLAYANLYGQPQIFVVNADGSDNHPLTPGLRPNWALNGGFIGYDTCENNKCGIFRINPDGGGKRQLSDDGGGGAAVSPNGKQIAYWSQADGDFEIYVINADGSGKKQLTKNSGNDALPAWSPDGKYIYYLSDQNGKGWAVMAMNANGSNQRRVVKTSVGNDPRRGWQYQRITVTWND